MKKMMCLAVMICLCMNGVGGMSEEVPSCLLYTSYDDHNRVFERYADGKPHVAVLKCRCIIGKQRFGPPQDIARIVRNAQTQHDRLYKGIKRCV